PDNELKSERRYGCISVIDGLGGTMRIMYFSRRGSRKRRLSLSSWYGAHGADLRASVMRSKPLSETVEYGPFTAPSAYILKTPRFFETRAKVYSASGVTRTPIICRRQI